jgi:hypothetical protein
MIYRFYIQWLDDAESITYWEFDAPSEEIAWYIGQGKAFREDWTATDSKSWMEKFSPPDDDENRSQWETQ